MYKPMERSDIHHANVELTDLRLSVEGLVTCMVHGMHQGLDRPLPVALQPLHSCCTPSIPRVFSTCSQPTQTLPDASLAFAEMHSVSLASQLHLL